MARAYKTTAVLDHQVNGQTASYFYLLGHDCRPEELTATLRAIIGEWLESSDGQEFLYSHVSSIPELDWVDALGNVPDSVLAAAGIERLDTDAHHVNLNPHDNLIPDGLRARIERDGLAALETY